VGQVDVDQDGLGFRLFHIGSPFFDSCLFCVTPRPLGIWKLCFCKPDRSEVQLYLTGKTPDSEKKPASTINISTN
jgi:hypothetical protein